MNRYLTTALAIVAFFAHGLLAASEPCIDDDAAAAAWGIYCPGDKHVSCTADLNDLGQFGWAYVHDYSGTHYLYNPTVSHHLTNCSTGYITRTWTAYNPYSGTHHSCTQTIHVGGGQYTSFGEDNINWPQTPVQLEGCSPNVNPYGTDTLLAPPTWDHVTCSQVGVSYTDNVFTVNNDCRKIIRTWKVVDWCQHDPYTGAGKWTFDQTIKVVNGDVPSYSCPDDVTISSLNCRDAYVTVPALVVDPSSCGGYYTVTNNSPYADSNGADLSGTYPVGKHKVKLIVNYGCGHKRNCHVEITVDDNKAPTPYCYHTLTTALMPVDTDTDGLVDDGMVEIWAEDLDRGSFANCSGGPVQFSFSSDVDDKSRMFSCAHVGLNQVDMWVTDHRGNQAYCTVNLEVQNNNANIPDCEPRSYNRVASTPLALSGRVMLPNQDPVAEAQLLLLDMDTWVPRYRIDSTYTLTIDSVINPDGAMFYVHNAELQVDSVLVRPTEHPQRMISATTSGTFGLDSVMATSSNYMVKGLTASVDYDFSINDAYVLLSHLVGLERFKSPYQYMAADINRDQVIDLTDFRLLFQYVQEGQDYPYIGDVVMVDASYAWAQASDALTYCPDEIDVITEQSDVTDQMWYAVQIGRLGSTPGDRLGLAARLNSIGLGIDEEAELRSLIQPTSSVNVYPNPFADDLQLAVTSPAEGPVVVNLYAVDGRLLTTHRSNVTEGTHVLDLSINSDYSGLVIYEVQVAEHVYTGRLLRVQ